MEERKTRILSSKRKVKLLEFNKIIGLKVVAIKGISFHKRKQIEPLYILFNDKKTYIELEEQDYYSYHDCNPKARQIWVWHDRERWKRINLELNANVDI